VYGVIIALNKKETMMKNKLPYVIFCIFLIIFTIGITYGNLDSILDKAIYVCLECIGIG